MEGHSSVIRPFDNDTQNSESLPDPFMTVRGLAFLQVEILSDQSSEDDHEENDQNEPTLATGESLFILEEEDLVTEHSKLVFGPKKTHKKTTGCKNSDSKLPARPLRGFRCHTSNIEHLYCMWHGSKYCCWTTEPNSANKWTMEEDLFENSLNYLECTDVMTDYANGIWQCALLGNDPVFLLETDQGDETKVSQDCLNECDPLLSGVTRVNEVSNNILAMDDLTSLCVSHSEPPAVDVKGDLPGDSLRALQPEMVITVGHPQDNTSSLKRKERCRLPIATAAIQNDQAGIEGETLDKRPGGDISACVKHNNTSPFMELYLVNVLDNSVKGLITMTDELTAKSLIYACSEDKEYQRGDQILELELIDEEYPGISAEHLQEQEVKQSSIKGIAESSVNDTHSTKLQQEEQDQTQENQPDDSSECSHILMERLDTKCPCTTEHAEEHTQLIPFLKVNISSPESSDQSNESNKNTEINPDIQGLEETKACLSQTENQSGRDTLGIHSEKCNNVIEDRESAELPIPFENSTIDEIVVNGPQVVDNGKEIINSGLQIVDIEQQILDNGSQIVDIGQQIVDNELQIVDKGSQIVDNELQIVDKGSQIVDNGSQIVDSALQIAEGGLHIVDSDCHLCEMPHAKPYSDIKCHENMLFSVINTLNICPHKTSCSENTQRCGITNSLSDAHIDVTTIKSEGLCDRVTGDNTLMDMAKKPDVLSTCLKTSKKSNGLMLDNSTFADDILRTNSAHNINGKQLKRNALSHQSKDKMNIKKKGIQHSSLNSTRSSFNEGDHKINGNIVVENYQGDIVEKPLSCRSKSSETLSLVKTMVSMHNNSTKIEKAHSLHVKDYIPNSKALSQVYRDPDTIRRAEPVQAQTSAIDQTKGASCSVHFKGSTSLCDKSTENKMVKKKFKSSGKVPTTSVKDELETLDVNAVFPPEEGKRVRRENSTEKATIKDSEKAPRLLHSIQAEMFPERSENLKLYCHFGEIHADSTITWTKDSKLLARIHRSSEDDSPVSLALVQTSKRDQGLYHCTLKNIHGKVTTEFHLTAEVLDQLTRIQEFQGGEEIEFNQLFFREDFITDMYFGGNLHGRIATEDSHFGEGVHRKAFRSKVMCGLLPVFNPGHLCVLKVHNAIAYGTKTNDELVQKNYKLAVQECYVQNTAREYAKIYAEEAEQLEEFGRVPEIIPIFLIHRPANNIPYATVEEELIGDFVKYSIRDGKEINVLRRDSEAGQKCCTFQHWVFEKTSGNLLVTDMQGVGMKLTDVGIATIGKGYKGFKGNCSISFIDQFKVLHQCNKYCEILGLKSLRPINPKQKKQNPVKDKTQPNPTSSRKSRHITKAKNKT